MWNLYIFLFCQGLHVLLFLCKRKICMYSLIHQKLRCVTSSGSQRDCTLGQILRELLNLVYLVSMIIFRPKKVWGKKNMAARRTLCAALPLCRGPCMPRRKAILPCMGDPVHERAFEFAWRFGVMHEVLFILLAIPWFLSYS